MKALHKAALLLATHLSSYHHAAAVVDCTIEFCENQLSPEYLLRYKINVPSATTVDVCEECTISMELIYNGEAWVSVALSTDGQMVGSEAVIGMPVEGTVQKYVMSVKSNDGVQPMPESQQTLSGTSVEVTDGQTIMKFTKIMKESGEIEISTGDNTFLWAYGASTTLGYHASRDSFDLNLSSGTSAPTPAPIQSTNAAPTPATEPAAAGSTLSCPQSLDKSTIIDAGATLHYAMVPSDPPGSGNGLLCGRLEAEHDGWIGLATSTDGLMVGSEAIIGLPGDDTVLKYDMTAKYNGVTPMSDDKQTLTGTSFGLEDGKTIMEFTKLLVEDGEIPILEEGDNIFLHARGGNTLGFHTTYLNFKMDFSTPSVDLKIGDEVCITNYIVDRFCIELGHFLDDDTNITLANPEHHSFHCLLDVPRCKDSGYLVLTDKDEKTGMHCLGYRLNDTDAVVAAGLAAGRAGYCTDCTGDESKPERGFRATVKGTVKELGDGTDGVTGTPVLENIEVLDESVECETTTVVNPVCMAPVVPPATELELATKDCTKEFCDNQLSPEYLLRYQINVPSATTVDVCEECTIVMELIYNGEAWVSVALSTDGQMVGSEAVIGMPVEGTVQKYVMSVKSNDGVQPMPESQQTLSGTSVEVTDGQTIMKFTKIMKESGEIEISTGDNTFLWAYGSTTTLGYHTSRASFDLNLSSGTSQELSVPNKSAWLAHGIMAFLAWGVFVPFAVQSSLLRDLLPKGPIWFKLHRGLNTTAYAFFIVIFAIAVAYTNKEGGTHFQNGHQKMGLAMFILAFFQVFGGIFRPHAPDSGEETKPVRKGWEVGHRVLGVTLLACGFWQMNEGIELYASKYSVSESDEDKLSIAYWVWIVVMSALIVLGGGYFKFKKKSLNDTNNDDAPREEVPEDDNKVGDDV